MTRAPAHPFILLVITALLAPLAAAPAGAVEVAEGRLDIVWGDPPPGSSQSGHTILTLTRDDGQEYGQNRNPRNHVFE